MNNREAMQIALETLDNMVKVDWREWDEFASVEDFVRWAKSRASFTVEALRAALAHPEKEWVGLTITETADLWEQSRCALPRYHTFKSLIEAKLKEKNSWLLTQLK